MTIKKITKPLKKKLIKFSAKILWRIGIGAEMEAQLAALEGHIVIKEGKKYVDRKQAKVWKGKAHQYIDWIWMNGYMPRSAVYKYLAQQMGVTVTQTHLGRLTDLDDIKRLVRHAKILKEAVIKEKLKIDNNNTGLVEEIFKVKDNN